MILPRLPYRSCMLLIFLFSNVAMAGFVRFVTNDNNCSPEVVEVKNKFYQSLDNEGNEWLNAIHKELKENRKLNLSIAEDSDQRVAAVHVKSRSDSMLIELAKKFDKYSLGFPRGLAFIVDLDKCSLLAHSCFYPKFENDYNSSMFTAEETEGKNSLAFSLKYSGSLGKITLFKHPLHGLSYACFSKNRASLPLKNQKEGSIDYPEQLYNLVRYKLDQYCLEKAWNSGIRGINVEYMMKEDQSHGYAYKKNGFIMTGAVVVPSFTNDTNIGTVNCNGNEKKYSLSDLRFAKGDEFKKIGDIINFDVEAPIFIADKMKEAQFIEKLNSCRDLLMYPQFKKILEETAGIRLVPASKYQDLRFVDDGVIKQPCYHEDIIDSDVIEGFVIYDSNKNKRWKYKLWPYINVTMYLRDEVKAAEAAQRDECVLNERKLDRIMDRWVMSNDPNVRAVCRWLVEQKLKNYGQVIRGRQEGQWITIGRSVDKQLVQAMEANNFDLGAVINQLREEAAKNVPVPSEGAVGSGVDHVKFSDTSSLNRPKPEPKEDRESNVKRLIMVVVGPLGWGKSTLGKTLAKQYPDHVCHIDGDALDPALGTENVLRLSHLRNEVTWSCAASAIAQGKIPVISTGGGALVCQPRRGKRCEQAKKTDEVALIERMKSLGIDAHICLFVPGDSFQAGHDSDFIIKQYADKDTLSEELQERVSRGYFGSVDKTTTQITNKIRSKVQDNVKFALSLLTHCSAVKSDTIYSYPRLKAKDFSLPLVEGLQATIERCRDSLTPLTSIYASRIELVCGVAGESINGCFYHQTLVFNGCDRKKTRIPENYPKEPYQAVLVEAFDYETDEMLGKFIAIPEQVYAGTEEDRMPHITIKTVNYPAGQMGILAKSYWQSVASENSCYELVKLTRDNVELEKKVKFEKVEEVTVTPYVLNYH